MQLTTNEIKNLTFGAYESEEALDGVRFYRMPDKQARYFEKHDPAFYKKGKSAASISIDFYTDSSFFFFHCTEVEQCSTRPWCYFDVLINGKLVATIGDEPPIKTSYSFRTDLPDGENRVTLFFPNLHQATVKEISLSDGAKIRPAEKKRRILFLGDSITHGYDAQAPSQSYANRVSFQTDSEAVNLAIGGACFAADCLDESIDYRPDMIVVAYGTNDWRKKPAEACFAGCRAFFDKLCKIYPDKPIFYILPIWRHRGCETPEQAESFWLSRNLFKHIASGYKNIKIIDLWEEIPRDLALFSDGLHPNSEGFAYYANGVIKHLNFEDKE